MVPALVRALFFTLTRFVAMMVMAILSVDERTSQLTTAYRIQAAVVLLCRSPATVPLDYPSHAPVRVVAATTYSAEPSL